MGKYIKENLITIILPLISLSGFTLKDLITHYNDNNMISISLATFVEAIFFSGLLGFLIWYFEGLFNKLSQKLETQNTDLSQKLETQNTDLSQKLETQNTELSKKLETQNTELSKKLETQNEKIKLLETFLNETYSKKINNIDSDIFRILTKVNLPQSNG